MAKKDDSNSIETTTTKAPAQAGATVIEESVAVTTELTQSIIQKALVALGTLSAEKAKLTGRSLDLVEALGQTAIRLAREATDGETALERQALGAADRLLTSFVRWGNGSALAVAGARLKVHAPISLANGKEDRAHA